MCFSVINLKFTKCMNDVQSIYKFTRCIVNNTWVTTVFNVHHRVNKLYIMMLELPNEFPAFFIGMPERCFEQVYYVNGIQYIGVFFINERRSDDSGCLFAEWLLGIICFLCHSDSSMSGFFTQFVAVITLCWFIDRGAQPFA